jgi:hypothetical protein
MVLSLSMLDHDVLRHTLKSPGKVAAHMGETEDLSPEANRMTVSESFFTYI